MKREKINAAIGGLGFGKEFIPIYQCHPRSNIYAICLRTRERLDEVGNLFGVEKGLTSVVHPSSSNGETLKLS